MCRNLTTKAAAPTPPAEDENTPELGSFPITFAHRAQPGDAAPQMTMPAAIQIQFPFGSEIIGPIAPGSAESSWCPPLLHADAGYAEFHHNHAHVKLRSSR